MTGRDDKMPSVLVLEFPGQPSLGRTTSPTIWDIFREGTVGDSRGRWETAQDGRGCGKQRKTMENGGRRLKTMENSRRRRKTAGDGGGWRGTVGDGPSLG